MLESLLTKLKAGNFIKKESPTQIFPCEICEICETTTSDFPNPLQILSASISTGYKVGTFLNVTTSFDRTQPYQLRIN